MQVQDFTVIRISPIVYNDRDILEIGVIFTQPPNWARKHTHKTLRQRQVMHVLADALVHKHKRRPHSEQRESTGTHRTMPCNMATWKCGKGLQHRFAVCSSSQSLVMHLSAAFVFAKCAHKLFIMRSTSKSLIHERRYAIAVIDYFTLREQLITKWNLWVQER